MDIEELLTSSEERREILKKIKRKYKNIKVVEGDINFIESSTGQRHSINELVDFYLNTKKFIVVDSSGQFKLKESMDNN